METKLNNVFKPNTKQSECIETVEGPVMVLAGPGTGKTFTIIQRIKRMLELGIIPSSILCLTYSEAAANEMKARLVKEIGAVASAVTVNTYHSFCNEIIKQYPNEFELLDGVSLVDDITKRAFMEDILKEVKLNAYKTKWGDSLYYIPEFLKIIDEIKSNQVTKEEYFNTLNTHPQWQGKMNDLTVEYQEREQKGKLVKTFLTSFENHKKKIEKAKEAWEIFERYDIKLKQNNFIDFNDMINMVLDVFETNNEFLKVIASKYKYFLVDEYQDTNYSQNRIVFNLSDGSGYKNIFVVGDDDQIIYEFQGAKKDTLERFLNLYPETKVICLNENMRSIQNILDFSYKVISQDKSRLEFNKNYKQYNISKILTAKNVNLKYLNEKIKIHSFADIKQENNYIADTIEQIIQSDKCPVNKNGAKDLSQIAILTRENNELNNFAKLLEAKNIQYQIKTSKSIFDIQSSLLTYFYLQTLQNNQLFADKLFGLLLCEPFEFDLTDYNFLLEENRKNHENFITNIENNIETHNWKDKEKVQKFLSDYNYLKKKMFSFNIKNLIIEVVNITGILQCFIENETDKSDNISAINRLIEEAQGCMKKDSSITLCEFLKHIDSAFKNKIPIVISKDEYTQNAVQLVTLHGSKGREFDFVFIPNLISKKWEEKKTPNAISLPIEKNSALTSDDDAKKSEQLRLLFVGITRAKHSLFLSFSNSIDGSPQEMTAYLSNAITDDNIVQSYNHELDKNEWTLEIVNSIKKSKFDYKIAFADEIKARIKEFVLSPSSLNKYLNCPRSFFYSEIMKIPVFEETVSKAIIGNVIHKTLQKSVLIAKENNEYPNISSFFDIAKEILKNEKTSSFEEEEEMYSQITKRLKNFYPYFVQTPYNMIFATEYYLTRIPFENFFIKGFIDRIEQNPDGSYSIYDYKSGEPKSKVQIADGMKYESYLNQLRFYKFSFEKLNPDKKVTQCGIVYIENPNKNYYITLTENDNNIIKEKISNVYSEIQKLNFNPVEQTEETCNFCKYKHLCKLNVF